MTYRIYPEQPRTDCSDEADASSVVTSCRRSSDSALDPALRSFLIAAAFVPVAAASAEPPPGGWQLLVPGVYHGDEAPARPGPGWLALLPVGGVWRLEPAMVRATRVHDPLLDAEGDKTGIALSSSRSEAIVLLKVPGIGPGKVDTPAMKFGEGPKPVSAGGVPLKVRFKADEYVIEGSARGIHVRNGAAGTLLPGVSAGGPDSDDSASLLWAGDLDRDGRLDLLFSYSGYNRGGVCLYLSSGADAGAQVRLTACHGGVGC